jgi:hypothetical protein
MEASFRRLLKRKFEAEKEFPGSIPDFPATD